MARKQNDLKALRNMISEAHDILRTTILPEERSQRAYELLTAAVHLADNLLGVCREYVSTSLALRLEIH